MKEEEKEKYSAFITEVSEILGIGKPGDIIKLCIITDNFFKPYQKRIVELEKENAEAKEIINAFLDFEASAMERGCYIADDTRRRAEDFIKEQKMTKEEPIDYRSVIYAIDHILLAYKSDISPNLKAKLTRWKNNLQKELSK